MAGNEIEKKSGQKEVDIDVKHINSDEVTISSKVDVKKKSSPSSSSNSKTTSSTSKTTEKSKSTNDQQSQESEENDSQENNLKNRQKNEASEDDQKKADEMFKDQDQADDAKKGKGKNADGNKEKEKSLENGAGDKASNLGKQVEAGSGKLPNPGQAAGKLAGGGGNGAGGQLGKALSQGLKNGAGGVGNAAKGAVKDAAKQAAKAAAKAVKEALKKAAAAAAKFLLANPITWIVIAIVLGGLLIYGIWKSDAAASDIEATVETVDTMKTAINEGKLEGEINQVNSALELNSDYGSYIGFTKNQTDYVYKAAVDTTNVSDDSSRAGLIKLYKQKFGKGDANSDGILRVSDTRELYKHILNTEKYNFNKIEWLNYNHDQDGSRKLAENELKKDTSLGIMYPNDSEMDAEKFMKLSSPYLISNYIPLSFLVAESNTSENSVFSTGIKSNQEILEELGVNGSGAGYNESSYVYQFLKYGLSDVTISQYQLKHYIMQTYYLDYNATVCHDEYTAVETKNYTYTINADGSKTDPVVTSSSIQLNNDTNTVKGDPTPVNTRRENGTGEEKVTLETVAAEYPTYTNVYYVTHAKVFDTIKDANYTYTKYNNANIETRTGANSESIIDSEYNEVDNEENKREKVTATTIADLRKYATCTSQGENKGTEHETTNSDGSKTVTYTSTTKYTVVGNNYTEKVGTRYDIDRQWDDEVTSGDTTTKAFNTSEVINFNKNEENDEEKSTISEEKFKESDSFKYYENLATEKKLNCMDVFDSNPKVFQNYISMGRAQAEYIGRGRDNVFNKAAYDLVLNKYMDTLADNNKLKFVYGSSLGYEVSSGSSGDGSGSYGTAYSLMLKLLHEFEGGGTVYQNAEGVDCYKVLNVVGNMTVGHGIDITVNPQWKTQLESQMGGASITFGTLVPCEFVDAIEEDFINKKLASIEATCSNNGIEVAEYQKHALLIRMYNTGNISGFPNAYKSHYDENVDNKYEEVYEKYKGEPENVSAITSCANLSSKLYENYLSTPTTSKGQVLAGLVTRRREEYYLFSLGYYTHNNLHAFYTQGLSFNGINLVNTDGSIDLDGCVQLQAALEDSVFDGKFHAKSPTMNTPWGHSLRPNGAENSDDRGNLSDQYKEFFAKSLYYQCPWWSRGRANIYLNSVNPEVFKGQFIRDGLGDGKNLAKGIADAYGVPFYTDLSQLTGNCIISYGANAKYGHTAYVEAVGNDWYVISHCGSGIAWQGVGICAKTNNSLGSGYGLVGFVKLDDIVAKYNK